MRKLTLASLVALMITPAAAHAEWVNVGIWGNGLLGQSALRNAQNNLEAANRRDSARQRSTATTARSQPRLPARPEALSFRRSAEVTDQIEQALAPRLEEMVSLRFTMDDPSSFVRSARTRAIYQRELTARNLPVDTVGGATALFLAVGWELANGRRLTPAQNVAVYRHVVRALPSTPLAQKSDVHRQQEAEMRLIISALWLQEARARASSTETTREMSDAVWEDVQTITGNDMRAYAVTASGFTEI